MKKEIADKWVEALRSGKYKQGHSCLNNNFGQCCLGVLCELAVEAGIIPQPVSAGEMFEGGVMAYDGEHQYLPDAVVAWAGMQGAVGFVPGLENEAEYEGPGGDYARHDLSELNDDGVGFDRIAFIIEKYWDGI